MQALGLDAVGLPKTRVVVANGPASSIVVALCFNEVEAGSLCREIALIRPVRKAAPHP
jgi:hypothetical protein